MRFALAGWATIAALLVAPGAARAHQSSVTHSDVVVDGAEVRYAILIEPEDLAEALGLPADQAPRDEELRAGAERALAYVGERIAVRDGDAICPRHDGALVRLAGRIRLSWTARCAAAVSVLVVDYDLFFDLDATHEAVLRVTHGGRHADTILAADTGRFVWDLSGAPPSGALAFLRSGIHHILFGFDHIAFVLALMIALVIAREPTGTWQRRRLGGALRATAVIVTSFTIAHSITLIAAALDWVAAPARLVESAIALSIAYTAIENIVRPDASWRFALTFGFGLLHGLGFARMLELPPDDVVVPLLAFNVGVELGQLAVVVLILPLAWALAGVIGGERYRRIALPAASAVLASLGLLWLAERLFDVTILGL
jgi:hypothetical protein